MRIALLLDPFSIYLDASLMLRVHWSDHAPQLARELLGRGHTVRGFGAPPGLIPRSGDDPLPLGDEAGRVEGMFVKHRGLRAFEPDVIVAYDALSPAAYRGARMARKTGAALVLVEAARRSTDRLARHAAVKVGELLWGRYVRRTANAVVALDSFARAQAGREGFAADTVCVVPYGVDTNQFRPGLTSTLVARHRLRGRILLYVGRLEERHGLDTLMTAFARTVGQRADWNLVLAGEGPLRGSLRAMADRLGVASRVHWVGRPRREELPGLMGASTLFALPAIDEEAIGRELGRALACGLPHVASDLPRLRGLVENEQTGLVVPPGDVEAWVEAMQRAAGAPAARERWSANARATAENNLSWSVVSAGFEEVLAQALARKTLRSKRGPESEAKPVSPS